MTIDALYGACALVATLQEAERIEQLLAQHGIAARLTTPSERYARLEPTRIEVQVPLQEITRARGILNG
jgi:hypothetical protein